MFRSLTISARSRPGRPVLAVAALLLAFNLAACSSDPPPDMNTVKKLVAEDRTFEALQTLIPLAQKGDPQAQYELAGFYHYGYVGSNDFAKALKWYRASAQQGYADSMVGLSVMYLGGQGVAKDRREAFVWLNLAAQYMADKKALAKVKNVRDEIGRSLTKDDIAFAKAESLLLQPSTSSIQPNEAESIDHLPATLAPQEAPAAVSSEPLQNVPPDTGPLTGAPLSSAPVSNTPALPEMELQPSMPAAPRPAPATTMPMTTKPASTTPASSSLPATTLPATTAPATPQPLPPPPVAPSSSDAAPAVPLDAVPSF
jgi:hypothetical protein